MSSPSPAQAFMRLIRRIGLLIDWMSNSMRRVRAYNDLERLSDRTLRDIGTRPGDLDRVLDGRWNRRS